ncbi:metalloregulator ArsR/SmtB family transcription factor [Streptomyces clavuligerus]|uniref:Putative transcriptional regulator n=1 Tax=Streptomyces clavuligerus TaxID=1901 RepID=B5GMA1_STRCL|nr:metalloregulator ArsR/SmtB family transcription factor [Streptomyces clavuligerus]ANW22329.1 transcriptional regulator [Streptomyces clavuligerus]AXU17228.1 transcriptional regulator [Streptomyces clavuligerus]EDY47447.1 transcriptional regulator [Streptomyces clavuligerus]EFG04410.1 Putative transcriptional regulator [Streptomyces clavuligerus]MBY6307127.1 helix-turn-helix transcriptional regulator [Streptomyces clavuligerus]
MDEVTNAIADPVRRDILVMLRGTTLTAGEIARHFPISRPAISRHLRVLRESGLVRDELAGTRRLYRLEPAALAELAEWIAVLRTPAGWGHRLDALETEVRRAGRERAGHRTTQDRDHTEDIA